MSRGRSSGSQEDDDLRLALEFQGLQISVQGPSDKALAFVQRLSLDLAENAGSGAPSSGSRSSIHEPLQVPPCPAEVSALSTKLSAASILSPAERVQRAWLAGFHARAALDQRRAPTQEIVPIDLPSKFFVVVRGDGYPEPRIIRSYKDFERALRPISGPVPVGHDFPSETEALAYLAAVRKRI